MLNRYIVALVPAASMGAVLALGAGLVVGAPDTAMPWSVLGSGGSTTSSSASYDLGSTAGQTAIGPTSSAGFQLGAGFWYGIDKDGDTLPDSVDPCPSVADCDMDGWKDGAELQYIGTDPQDNCADNAVDAAWPPDFNNDGSITGFDLSAIAGVIGQSVPPASARRDIAPDPPDGAVTGADLSAVAGRIGTSCLSP